MSTFDRISVNLDTGKINYPAVPGFELDEEAMHRVANLHAPFAPSLEDAYRHAIHGQISEFLGARSLGERGRGRRVPSGPRSAFCVDVWEERDRLHVALKKADVRWEFVEHYDQRVGGETHEWVRHGECDISVADWWDDDARSMFEDGFFRPGRDLADSVIDYAAEMGLIAVED